MELALACDLRWVHLRAVFGLPEARLGLLPGWGGMAMLRRLVPLPLFSMMVGGEFLGARRACEAGLATRLFAGGDFDGQVLRALKAMVGQGERFLSQVKVQAVRTKEGIELSRHDAAYLALWDKRRTTDLLAK
jgi:enoyl-CoA hydratase/carnithine racemase